MCCSCFLPLVIHEWYFFKVRSQCVKLFEIWAMQAFKRQISLGIVQWWRTQIIEKRLRNICLEFHEIQTFLKWIGNPSKEQSKSTLIFILRSIYLRANTTQKSHNHHITSLVVHWGKYDEWYRITRIQCFILNLRIYQIHDILWYMNKICYVKYVKKLPQKC